MAFTMSASFYTVCHSLSFPGKFVICATATNLADNVILAAVNGMGDASCNASYMQCC